MESEEAQPVVISVATPKGGAGKTTTCVLLALQLAREGYRVLAVDTDPQASLTRWSENAKSSGFSLENITIKQISMIEASEQEQALVSIINNAVDHDIVLIDVQGSARGAIASGLRMADLILIPAQQHLDDVEQAASFYRFIQSSGVKTQVRIVLNNVQKFARNSVPVKTAMAYIKNNDLPLLPVFIEHRITFATVRTGADLYDLDSDAAGVNNASTNLSAITSAIINTINESGN